jgi:hypothetical protein
LTGLYLPIALMQLQGRIFDHEFDILVGKARKTVTGNRPRGKGHHCGGQIHHIFRVP